MTPAAVEVELKVVDLDASRRFYVDVLGFSIAYQRPEDRFIALRRGAAVLLLEEVHDNDRVSVGPLEPPLGRGVNLQFPTRDAVALERQAIEHGHRPMIPLEDRWYRVDDRAVGNRQFWLQDPDGYLLRFAEDLGSRPATA